MAQDFTFTMIKPGAMKKNHAGPILGIINEHGFRISALKMVYLSKFQAEQFYIEHKGKSFYEALVNFMSSGPIMAAVLEKENAIAEFRALIGATDPEKAQEGTIRRLFAESMSHNAVHGSDSKMSAQRESQFFFSEMDRF